MEEKVSVTLNTCTHQNASVASTLPFSGRSSHIIALGHLVCSAESGWKHSAKMLHPDLDRYHGCCPIRENIVVALFRASFFIYIFPPLFISALNVSNRKLAAIVAGMLRSAHAHNGFCCIQIRKKKCSMNRNFIENQPCHFPPSVFPFSRSYCSDYLYLI